VALTHCPTRRAAIALGAAGCAALLAAWLFWFRAPPQMGADEEAFKCVDALFTAVTARDDRLLGQCEQRLGALKQAGKLPAEAATFLDGVIGRARAGRWESAADRLYNFMLAQRRDATRNDRPI
jgi:hypothetical protein